MVVSTNDYALKEINEQFKKPFLDFVNDFINNGEPHLVNQYSLAMNSFHTFTNDLRDKARGVNLPPGFVPEETFILCDTSDCIYGLIRVRKTLNQRLLKYGGNIAYAIKPSSRNKGLGSVMLSLVLSRLRKQNILKVLITCDSDNIGSAKVIENNNGVLDSEEFHADTNKMIRRYWIAL